MFNQWAKELVAMADALVLTSNEDAADGKPCRFCKGTPKDGSRNAKPVHTPDCPVTFAERVVQQAVEMRASGQDVFVAGKALCCETPPRRSH